MRTLLVTFGLVLAAVIQVSALPYLSGEVDVNLVLLIVVAWGIIRGMQEGLLWGLIGGLALSALSAAPFGTIMAVLGTIGALGGIRGLPLLRGSSFGPVVAAGLASILYDGLLMALLALLGREWSWVDVLRNAVVPAALVNALAMVPVYGLLHWLDRRLDPESNW